MAVSKLSTAQLKAALRLGDSAEESAEVDRLLQYARLAIVDRAPDAPMEACNEAIVRLCAYLYDKPSASRNLSYANALRNSGAGSILRSWVKPRVTPC